MVSTSTAPPTAGANRRAIKSDSQKSGGRSEWKIALVFIAPALVGFLVFFVYPTLRGFYFSLTQYNLLGTPKFIGFDNFVKISKDPLFWKSNDQNLWMVLGRVT